MRVERLLHSKDCAKSLLRDREPHFIAL